MASQDKISGSYQEWLVDPRQTDKATISEWIADKPVPAPMQMETFESRPLIALSTPTQVGKSEVMKEWEAPVKKTIAEWVAEEKEKGESGVCSDLHRRVHKLAIRPIIKYQTEGLEMPETNWFMDAFMQHVYTFAAAHGLALQDITMKSEGEIITLKGKSMDIPQFEDGAIETTPFPTDVYRADGSRSIGAPKVEQVIAQTRYTPSQNTRIAAGLKHNEHLRIHFISDWNNRDRVKALANLFAKHGHFPVSSWHILEPFGDDSSPDIKQQQTWAFTDLADLDCADVVVRLGGNESSRGGQFVEMGYAIAKRIPVFILKPNGNIFEHVRGVAICDTALRVLSQLTDGRDMAELGLPYPLAIARKRSEEAMKLEALCSRFNFSEDKDTLVFIDIESGEEAFRGQAGLARDQQIEAAYATLLPHEAPEDVLGVEAVVDAAVEAAEEMAADDFTVSDESDPEQEPDPEVISEPGTDANVGNRANNVE